MLRLMSIAVFVLGASGCLDVDFGCTDDAQCRTGRFCVGGRCQGTAAADPSGVNNVSPGGCLTDPEGPRDSLCRDGQCDEYQCRNADGTDTSPDCDCDNFTFNLLPNQGCSFEERCFSGNLLLECIQQPSEGLVCTCYEALEPVAMLMPDADFCSTTMSDDDVYAACGWVLP